MKRPDVSDWFDRCSSWWASYYLAAVRHAGMSGDDGQLSFSKTFGLLVLISYYLNTNLPPGVAITLIISAHGTKVLLYAIKRGVFNVKALDSWQKVQIDKREERVGEGWNSERQHDEA